MPGGKGPQHDELIDWIKAELDEPVMALLRETWRRAKGKMPEAAAEVTGR